MSGRVNGSEQAEAVTGRTLNEVEADVERTIEGLQALKAEHATMDESIKAATKEQDAVMLEGLEQRARSLQAQVAVAQGRLWQLYGERARLQLPAAEEKAEAAKAEYERAHADYLAAHERTNRLGVEANNTMMTVARLRQSIEENERRVTETMRRLPANLRGALARQS